MEFLVEYKEQILDVVAFLTLPVFVFIVSLAVVYLFGRMWGIVHAVKVKNIIAFLSMLAVYLFYYNKVDMSQDVSVKIWKAMINMGWTIVIYVLVGFKLYERADKLQDKVVSDEKTKTRGKRNG